MDLKLYLVICYSITNAVVIFYVVYKLIKSAEELLNKPPYEVTLQSIIEDSGMGNEIIGIMICLPPFIPVAVMYCLIYCLAELFKKIFLFLITKIKIVNKKGKLLQELER